MSGSDTDGSAEQARADEAVWRSIGLEPGDVVGGKYELKRRLGRGGMGAVFEAVNLTIRRPVAIKVMRPELAVDPKHATRFQREARAAAEVRHPAIVDILDFGVHEGRPFIVMELLEGETLRERVHRAGWLTPAEAIALLDPVLRALSAAHAKGVIHRDIKPDNIFLAEVADDDAPAVKVLDFGIAKVASDDTRITVSRMALGTAGYMAPEQVRSADTAGPAVDQYAAAVVLYEALSGRLPHEAASYNEMIITKVTEPPAPLRKVRPDLPEALEEVVSRALSQDPEERFDGVDAFRDALQPFVGLAGPAPSAAPIDPLGDTVGSGELPDVALAETALATGAATPKPALSSTTPEPSPDLPRWVPVAGVVAALLVAGIGWWAAQPPTAPEDPPAETTAPELPAVLSVEDARQVTHNSGSEPVRGAALSGDGNLLAFVDAEGLHVKNLREATIDDYPTEGGELAWAVTWIPHTLRVLVTGWRDDHERILSMSITGAPRWEVVRDRAIWPAVSPDGARVAFYDRHGLSLMRPDGSELASGVRAFDDDTTVSQPAWSPDGRWVAWLQVRGEADSELVALELDERHAVVGEPVVVSEPRIAVEDCNPVWLPSGHLVYSVSTYLGDESRSELRSRRLDEEGRAWSGPTEAPACPTDHCYSVSASRDGTRMLVEVWRERVDLATLDLSAEAPEPTVVLDRDATEFASAWTNDGEGMLLSSNEAGHYSVYRLEPGASRPAPIARTNIASIWATATPDSSAALFWRTEETEDEEHVRFTLVRAPLDGSSTPSPLGEHGGVDAFSDLYNDFAPVFPPYSQRVACRPGAGCVLSRGEDSELVFYTLDADTGATTERARFAYPWAERSYTWRPGLNDDAVLISHAYAGEFRFERVDFASASLSPVPLPEWCDPDSAELGAEGEIYVACRGVARRGWSLGRVDADGAFETVWASEGGAEIRQPLLSPDGRRLLFTYAPSDSNVFLLDAR